MLGANGHVPALKKAWLRCKREEGVTASPSMYRFLKGRLYVLVDFRRGGEFYIYSIIPAGSHLSASILVQIRKALISFLVTSLLVSGPDSLHTPQHYVQSTVYMIATSVPIKSSSEHVHWNSLLPE